MVTLDERVEAMMTLANKNWKTESPRRGRTESPCRDDYHCSNPETGDSPGAGDADSLIRNNQSRQRSKRHRPEDEDDNCLLKCGRCLAQVPCSSMCCWVFMATAVSMCCGGVLIAIIKGQDMFGKDPDMVSLTIWICIGVLFGMIFMGTWFLIVAVISTGRMSRRIFNSRKKNICARVLNGFAIMFMIFLQLVWILAAAFLALPVAVLGLAHYRYYVLHVPCIDLQYYALSSDEWKICDTPSDMDLQYMMYKSKPVLIAVCFALVGAVLTVKSMTFFILCASSNVMYLKESRFAAYNVHQNGKRKSSIGSHQDTKM